MSNLPKPHSTTVSATDFESVDSGSNPDVAANFARDFGNESLRMARCGCPRNTVTECILYGCYRYRYKQAVEFIILNGPVLK